MSEIGQAGSIKSQVSAGCLEIKCGCRLPQIGLQPGGREIQSKPAAASRRRLPMRRA